MAFLWKTPSNTTNRGVSSALDSMAPECGEAGAWGGESRARFDRGLGLTLWGLLLGVLLWLGQA